MIIKLRIESDEINIRKFTDRLRTNDEIKVWSISEIKPKRNEMSDYKLCFAEIEFNNSMENK